MKRKETLEPKKYRWIRWGIIISLIAACIYTATYGYFQNKVELIQDSPLENEMTIKWLCESNYLLYRDLYVRDNPEVLTYAQLYLEPREGKEWIETLGLLEETTDSGIDESYWDESNHENVSYDEWSNISEDIGRFNEYFSELESNFTNLNKTFDYRIEDLTTGEVVSNYTEEEDPQNLVFLLTYRYDELGNFSVDGHVVGKDTFKIRKNANEAGRDNHLLQLCPFLDNNFFSVKTPKNCLITYRVTDTEWEKIVTEGWLPLRDAAYHVNSYDYFAYADAGVGVLFFALFFLVLAGGFFLSPGSKILSGSKLLHMVLEVTVALAFVWVCGSCELSVMLMSSVAEETAAQALRQWFTGSDAQFLVVLLNIAALTLMFFGGWFIGINLRDIRTIGIKEYIKTRSLIYRFFPFIKAKVMGVYDSVSHFDVTRNAHKLIIKVVLINAVVLFFISSLWFGGFGIVMVYSILLYFILRKYISDLQRKYGLLLAATNEMAQGNLNVTITDDLGVFEPFKPQLLRIQNGFKTAVEEEVKSQRMKAELITNVSHDLKTPLTAIITYIDLLKSENLSEEKRKEYLNTLERKSLRLKVLIEDLFEVSKANSHNMTLNLMDVDIINLIKQVSFEMTDKLEASNLDLRMNLPEEKVILSLDSQRTYRIYENLFGNIAKYALPGTRVYVAGSVEADKVIITLKNITADEIYVNAEELTDRFVRGDTSRNTEGSGLGLAIAKSFTELQGGKMTVEIDGDLFKVTTIWYDTEF